MKKKEIYLYYGVLNNIHGDINYVEDGEGQQQLVEGGDHLRLPVSCSWFNLSVSRSVADTLSFIDFIFFQCFAKTKQVAILPNFAGGSIEVFSINYFALNEVL